ncbi:dihydroorotase [Oceanobacillus sojae]|uniref:dihydroorotase n=1 Tax=Oceanobacillus sojae TaxID=582851 RepID=UPI0009886851|nr:dihydroorotase [Oceanobacillus sojae]MCT1904207.1 dihydroorotase [Oceanobacillus sojae]
MKTKLTNAKCLTSSNELVSCEILIEDDKIVKTAPKVTEQADKTIDADNNLVVPGFIDVHIHLREPGGEYKETIATGTQSAARGGYTTVCNMPNTNPVPDSKDTLEKLLQKIKEDAVVRVLPYASITKGLKGEERTNIKELFEQGAFAFTDDGVGIQTANQMFQAMKEAAACGAAIVAHCEDNSLVYGGVTHDGEVSKRLNLPGIPSLSESVQIARDVLLAEAADCHYHVCHVSTKESVRVIRDAKRAGIKVTGEVSPHHLLLNETDVLENDADFKMNPPLRGKDDQEALIEGLLDGTLDFIATDHAPHGEEEKANGFLEAPFGIVGLETAFPLLYTHLVQKNVLSLHELIDRMTKKPADVFGLPYGTMEEGAPADLTILDLDKTAKIDRYQFASKGKNTPFHGWEVNGFPVMTIVNGEVVFKEDSHA